MINLKSILQKALKFAEGERDESGNLFPNEVLAEELRFVLNELGDLHIGYPEYYEAHDMIIEEKSRAEDYGRLFNAWDDGEEPIEVKLYQELQTMYVVPSGDDDYSWNYFYDLKDAEEAAKEFINANKD